MKTTYLVLTEQSSETRSSEKIFHLVWKWSGSLRVQAFLWKLGHARLMTNEERVKLHMTKDTSCLRCLDQSESIMHYLRDCNQILDFWSKLVPSEKWSQFASRGFHSWLVWNLESTDVGPFQFS